VSGPRSARWIGRVAGALGVAMILLLPAMGWFLRSGAASPWTLALVLPAGLAVWLALEWTFRPALGRASPWLATIAGRRLEVAQVAGIPLLLHWTLPLLLVGVLPGFVVWPALALAMSGAYLSVILIHEIGHVLAARLAGCQVVSVELGVIHGATQYSPPWSWRRSMAVAWGGVLAQLMVALPAWAWRRWLGPADWTPATAVLTVLGPVNLAVAAINLLPLPGLDGALAWSFPGRRPPKRPRGLSG
jgi:hypothetical protein